jgi:hypothetical protein
VVPDHEPGPGIQLELPPGRRGHDAPEVSLPREEEVDERAGFLSTDPDRLPLEIGEGASAQPVEVEIPVEEDERRPDHDAVVEHLAGRERQEPVHAVAAPDLEAHEAAQRMVEERVRDDAKVEAAAPDSTASHPPGRMKKPHPGWVVPGPRAYETSWPSRFGWLVMASGAGARSFVCSRRAGALSI